MAASDFLKIDKTTASAAELLQKLRDNHVLLEVEYSSTEHTCSVTSYACSRSGTLMVYAPVHTLNSLEGLDEVSFSEMDIRTSEEWTARFLSENSFLNIQDESYYDSEYEEDIDQIKALLMTADSPRSAAELYLSGDHGNFYGPLEIDCMEWWIRSHPGYHTDTVSHTVDGFEISEAGTLLDYSGNETDLDVLPSGIKRIGRSAFHRSRIRRISIPDGVEEIGFCAFEACEFLEAVTFPESLSSIGSYAFSDCTALKEIRIPSSVRKIASRAFRGCTSLETVVLPEKTAVGFKAFSGCPEQIAALSPKFDISGGHLLAADSALEGHVCVPSGVSTITGPAFGNDPQMYHYPKKITSLLLPKSVSKIEKDALPYSLRYLMILPGKRTVNCLYDLSFSRHLNLVFHAGRTVRLHCSLWAADDEVLFVSFPEDGLFVRRTPFENSETCSRYFITSRRDIEVLADRFRLHEHAEIMQYLNDLSRSLPR